MNTGKTIFAQLMEYIPKYDFHKLVSKYKGNYKARTFSCWDQLLCMGYAQLSYRESLRDITACLNAQSHKLYPMGIRGNIAKSNLARANEQRDWRIYAELAQLLISRARSLYSNDPKFVLDLDNTVYALDSTTIDLCLSLFPWAKFRDHKAAIKLNTLLDLRGAIPTFIQLTTGLIHDVNVLDVLIPEPGSYYVMDKGYLDFARLYRFTQNQAFFVIRAKRNLTFQRMYSNPVNKSTGLRCDQIIRLKGYQSQKRYPEKMRRVKFYIENQDRYLVLLSNNFVIPAETIPELYRLRWDIELFFKWIKLIRRKDIEDGQHLRIKAFYGTSLNAVKTQVWIAVSMYVLVAIIKKSLNTERTLYTILQILSVSLFEKVPLYQLLTESCPKSQGGHSPNQLILWDL